jgi:O-methyltransferase
MDNSFILDIMEPNSMMSIEQEMNMYHLLSRVIFLKIPGAIVELGCHEGLTAAIMQKTLNQLNSKKNIYVYDSFEGLPEQSKKDKGPINFKKGSLKTNEKKLIETFKRLKLKTPKINKCWFKDIPKNKLPKKICFAHLDGDFYSSVKESLEIVYPLLVKDAIMIIDDYCNLKIHKKIEKKLNSNKWNHNRKRKYLIKDYFPGVKKACDEFFNKKKEKVHILISGDQCHAYIVKK